MPPITASGVSFHHMTSVFPPKTGGVIPGDAVAGPADLAAWLTTHPHLRATRPSQPRKYKDCGKVEGE